MAAEQPRHPKIPLAAQTDSTEQQVKSGMTQEAIKQLSQSAGVISGSCSDFASALLDPFSGISVQIKAFYLHYQAKGLGQGFLMTVAGSITLILGFGYLLKYSINN